MTPDDPSRMPRAGGPAGRDPLRRAGLTALAGLLAFVTIAVSLTVVASPPSTATPAASAPATPSTTPSSTPRLPEPTGPHPVGVTSLYLEDASRPDPWVPEATTRELMVSVWYPAAASKGRRAQYVTREESERILKGTGMTGLPPDALSRTRTSAIATAEPAGGRHTLPLVVLSPGFTWPASSLTALAEELASHGYVVAGIDHTYETFATTFPDGRVTTCAACTIEGTSGKEFGKRVEESRAADVAFVLDELTGPHPAWEGGSLIDLSRIGMAGSSLGGASAVVAMLNDSRIRAGVNLDGTMFVPIPPSGLSRPFLLMGQHPAAKPGNSPTWDRDWERLTGWRRWLVVAGAVHPSFTDYDLLAQQFGADLGSDLHGTRSVEITRRYVRAFFDLHLRGQPQPLLEQPSARYPEVRFCTPDTGTCT